MSVDAPLRDLVTLSFKLFIAGIPVAIVFWLALVVIGGAIKAL